MPSLAGIRQFLASHTEMSSARNPPSQGFPAVPSTLNAGDYEMRDYSQDHDNAPPTTLPYYTPYLGLRARLSQVWINRWTILLLLIICRLLLAISTINHDIGSAKREALAACTSVEHAGSTMASMPHYLSQGVNAMAADGVTTAVNGLMQMLLLSITGVEEIVLFVINMMTSTYMCLITLAVSGSLHAAIDIAEKVGAAMNTTISSITGDMASTLKTFSDDLSNLLKAATSIPGIKNAPTIDLSSQIAKLNSIQIDPSTMDADLTKLNNSIPTFADVQNFTNTVIRLPFEEVKKLINQSYSAYTFDKSVFPVAQKKSLSFCSNDSTIDKFFDEIVKAIYTARTVFIVVLLLAAILVCIPMAYLEIRRWRTTKQRSVLLQKHAFDPMDVVYIASRPYTTTAGIKLSSRFKSPKRQILARWFIAYATSLPAMFLLALGLAGLFSCLCQFVILKLIDKEVPKLAHAVGNFADDVVHSLNNASESWATDANNVINSTNVKLNDDLFGWVNTSTTAVNSTLNAFTDEMNKVLNATFGGTILYEPIQGVINCLIELKIAGVQKGLTWVHDNAHVDLPEFRPDVFSLGAAASLTNTTADDSFLANPGAVASDDITSAVVKVSNALESGIRTEAIISSCVLGLFFFIMLIGLGRVLVGMFSHDKHRGEGGPVAYTGQTRGVSLESDNPTSAAPSYAFREPTSGYDEKLGAVGRRSVEASMKPGLDRKSSYGFVEGRQ
ncbi:Plasma membrane fusion protein [Lachnellula hyalina]|uniref:Plasma membrane fusion protein PRM1 n=1 Tax=Lachnellula hyalina TaxID=1316788 RepID=A0A8H8R780_9HELO|nr:Plasma membrane fusion protein [Lachnellula hyalina]TVY29734.1 Plasma membrane fusion protein [Lachnellula hyalina]